MTKTWFWFFFPFTGKGLDKDHQSSPFKPALLTVVDIEKKLSHLNSFMDHHFSTKKQKTAKICMWWQKKNIIYICPALSSQVWKNPEPRFTRKQKKKSGHSPLKKKSTSLAFPAWKIKALCKNGSFRWRIYDLPTNFMNEKCKPDRKRKIQEKMYSFLCCTFFTLTNKYPPHNTEKQNKKNTPTPIFEEKKLNYQPNDKSYKFRWTKSGF